MSDVFMFKIVSGETIFAKSIGDANGYVFVSNPLVSFDRYSDEGYRGIILNRYSQFSGSHTISLSKGSIVFQTMASDEMTDYYNTSLEYVISTDNSINDSIRLATAFIKKTLDSKTEEGPQKANLEKPSKEEMDAILANLAPGMKN